MGSARCNLYMDQWCCIVLHGVCKMQAVYASMVLHRVCKMQAVYASMVLHSATWGLQDASCICINGAAECYMGSARCKLYMHQWCCIVLHGVCKMQAVYGSMVLHSATWGLQDAICIWINGAA